jgi:serralysin
MATLDTSQDTLVFDDEFNSLSAKSAANSSGTWNLIYNYNNHWLPANGEQEYYVDPTTQTNLPNPFSTNNGVLTIQANPTPSNLLGATQNQPYTSGAMTTIGTFAQTYGVFEMRAQLPAGQGLWPAFWLLPANGQWPPEIDIMEMLGNQVNTDYTTVHSNSISGGSSGQGNTVANTTTGYHTYAVDWEPDTITFYFDGQQVFQTATPSDLKNMPMYMLLNLAVGGSWPGNPNSSTQFPANYNVDWVRVYSTANTIADYNHTPAPNGTSDSTPGPDAGTSGTTTGGSTGGTTGSTTGGSTGGSTGGTTSSGSTGSTGTGSTSTTSAGTTTAGDPPLSADPVTQVTGGSTAGTIYAPAGTTPTKFYSPSGLDTFVANAGDDTFLITNNSGTSQHETIVLPSVHGVETVQWYGDGSYTLQDGITNLFMMHSGTGIGNSMADRLVASPYGNTLVAGTGNDLLVGGAGADTFVIKGGLAVQDTIASLGANDVVQLTNSYADFATALSHMSQAGSDVVLDMGGGETLTLRGVALSSLTASEFSFLNPASTTSTATTGGSTGTTSTGTTGTGSTGTTSTGSTGTTSTGTTDTGSTGTGSTGTTSTGTTTTAGDPPLSADPVTQVTGGSTAGTIYAPAGTTPTKFYSPSGLDTFVANAGDDTFLITNNSGTSQHETIVLPSVHGVETVQWYGDGSYTLQDGITNLFMMHSGTGIGNSMADRLVASPYGNTLVAGTGNDLLVGGAGADTFVIKGGLAVQDTIASLGANDVVQLTNSYADFATALSHMSQAGSDVVLDMGGGETLTLRGVALSSLTASEFSFLNPASTASTGGTTGTGSGTTSSTGSTGTTSTGTTGTGGVTTTGHSVHITDHYYLHGHWA